MTDFTIDVAPRLRRLPPYLFGRIRVSGPDPERRTYHSFASFSDPDGNGWLLQEVTARLPGRVDAGGEGERFGG